MAEELPQMATWEQRKDYFLIAAILLWVSLFFLLWLLRDWLRKDSPLRAKIFQPFLLSIIADYFFVFVYAIYHTYNTIVSWSKEEDPISDPSGAVCKVLGFFTLFSAVFICIAIAVAWASILQIVKDSTTFDVTKANNYNPWLYNGGGFVLALVFSAAWYAYALASDTQGVFMGLFCCVDLTQQGNAGITVVLVSAAFGASGFFAYKSHKLVKHAIEKASADIGESLETHRADVDKDEKDAKPANVAARNLGALALATSIGYVLTWGLLGFLCLLIMFGVDLGNIILLIGSALIKLRAPVDVILIFRSAMYRSLGDKARRARDTQASSAAQSMQSMTGEATSYSSTFAA